jgi:hypothetical protein
MCELYIEDSIINITICNCNMKIVLLSISEFKIFLMFAKTECDQHILGRTTNIKFDCLLIVKFLFFKLYAQTENTHCFQVQ